RRHTRSLRDWSSDVCSSDLARVTGRIQMQGFSVEKLIFQSLPGVYVTALVYVPDDHSKKHPAVLVPAGHAADGKFHYQSLSQRQIGRASCRERVSLGVLGGR